MYKVIVVIDRSKDIVVGAGALVIEQKFIRNCNKAGHIEDICVLKAYRGKKLGFRII